MSMKKIDLEAMSVDDLWSLHEQVSRILSARITSEKRELKSVWRFSIVAGASSRAGMLRSPTTLMVRPDVDTRGFFRNIAILRRRPKHGRAAGSNRAGWLRP